MTARTILKRTHAIATVWFVACVGYLVAAGLRQAGFKWWLVFSLSGYSTGMLLLLVSLYLFALYRGAGGGRRIKVEHPLTSSDCYMGFYVSTPLLVGLITALGTADASRMDVSWVRVGMGTLTMTFIAWVVIDPLIGVLEMLLPVSRRHRAARIRKRKAAGSSYSQFDIRHRLDSPA